MKGLFGSKNKVSLWNLNKLRDAVIKGGSDGMRVRGSLGFGDDKRAFLK